MSAVEGGDDQTGGVWEHEARARPGTDPQPVILEVTVSAIWPDQAGSLSSELKST